MQADEKRQIVLLLHVAGELIAKIFETFTFTAPEDENKFEDVEAKFEAYFHPRSTKVIDSYKFQARYQLPEEILKQFITDLKNMVKRCNYGNQTDRMLRDVGI
uniref:Retrotransposon gag domain-containing protein n=1 Tax=Strigamia maritima TaxID=126957 RepID=T1IJF9_STRMM